MLKATISRIGSVPTIGTEVASAFENLPCLQTSSHLPASQTRRRSNKFQLDDHATILEVLNLLKVNKQFELQKLRETLEQNGSYEAISYRPCF